MRRATRYEPPRIHSGSSAGATQRCSRSRSSSSSFRLFVPSLKPMRLRGVSCARLVDDVRPKPSCDQRMTTRPRPIRARLRTAWKTTCGSSAQACTQMSPPDLSGSSASFGNTGSSGGCVGDCPRGRACRRTSGPKPNVTVSRAGRRSSASPVSSGGTSWFSFVVADHLALAHEGARRRPLLQELADLVRILGAQVERGEMELVLRRRRDAGLAARRRTGTSRRRREPLGAQALDADARPRPARPRRLRR